MKLDILAFAAHPDDVELSCSGTLVKHVKQGYKVGIVDLTQGELGSRGSAEIRTKEAQAASDILGIHVRENLKMQDGFFANDKEHQLQIIKSIRKYKPTIILANATHDRHPDHGKGAALVSDAAFLSGLRRIETEINGEIQQHWRPKSIYHYIQDFWHKPNIVLDITVEWEIKMKSILAFKSQFYNPEDNSEPTPISTKEFLKVIEGRALQFGRKINTTYGEGFIANRAIKTDDLLSLE